MKNIFILSFSLIVFLLDFQHAYADSNYYISCDMSAKDVNEYLRDEESHMSASRIYEPSSVYELIDNCIMDKEYKHAYRILKIIRDATYFNDRYIATIYIGDLYFFGFHLKQDKEKAFEIYHEAFYLKYKESPSSDKMFDIASNWFDGSGVSYLDGGYGESKKGYYWLSKLSESGDLLATKILSNHYYKHNNFEKNNILEAIRWHKKLEQLGEKTKHVAANLAYLYFINAEFDSSTKWKDIAIKRGFDQEDLNGRFYNEDNLRGLRYNFAGRKRYDAVFFYTKMLAELNNEKDQYQLSQWYFGRDKDTRSFAPVNQKTALTWLTKSATNGFDKAQLELVLLYMMGKEASGIDLDQDLDKMEYWINIFLLSKQGTKTKFINFLKTTLLEAKGKVKNSKLINDRLDAL